jgi:hypothetical protein
MKNTRKILMSFLLMLFCIQVLVPQTVLQVVTRTIEREYDFSPSDYLIVNAEKGIIDIQPWNENKIKVIVRIVTKNNNLDIAKEELNYITWTDFLKNKVLQLSNRIELPGNKNLSSIVRVEYSIRIPQGAHFSIYNKFGQVKVTDLNSVSKYELQYCDMDMRNTSGTIRITSNIGDLSLSDIQGFLQISSKYSTFQITNPKGICDISSVYGEIRLNLIDPISILNITAERCDVFVSNKNCQEINLTLETKYGKMNLLESCYIKNSTLLLKKSTGSSPNNTDSYSYFINDDKPTLKVKSVYGNIVLN